MFGFAEVYAIHSAGFVIFVCVDLLVRAIEFEPSSVVVS